MTGIFAVNVCTCYYSLSAILNKGIRVAVLVESHRMFYLSSFLVLECCSSIHACQRVSSLPFRFWSF